MAVHPPITIAADGTTLPVHVNHGDVIYWKATPVNGVYPMWFIIFPSPFIEHFIVTDPRNGQSGLFTVRKTKGTYSYVVSSVNDPTIAQIEKAEESGRKRSPVNVVGGGGIIIDS